MLIVAPGSFLRLEPATPGDQTEAALDGGLLVPVGGLPAPASGDHWLAIAARDTVGNVSPLRWVRLRVDAEPPDVRLEVAPSPVRDENGRLWVPGSAHANGRAADPLAGVARLWIESGGRETASPDGAETLAIPLGADGAAEAWAVDRVGNRSERVRLTVNVDARPPTARIEVVGAKAEGAERLVLGPEATLRLDHQDGESGVASWTGSVDGKSAGPDAWPGPWPAGRHDAAAKVVDRVGNQGVAPVLAFDVDAAAPNVTWEVEDPGARGDDGQPVFRPPVTVRVLAEDAPAGVAELAWSENGKDWRTLERRFETSSPSVLIRARDRVGNEATASASWRLDGLPPRILANGREVDPAPAITELDLGPGNSLRLSARDETAGVARFVVSIDSGPWELAPTEFLFLTKGTHHVAVEGVDRLGNTTRAKLRILVRRVSR